MPTEYEQQLLETIERQERELVKCREWMDTVRNSLDRIRDRSTKVSWNDKAMSDLRGMYYGIDMVSVICDHIREQASKIAEEEIQKIHKTYGRYDDGN